MNFSELLKKFLPGLLPLLAFIIADEFLGPTIGIIVAVSLGLVQLGYAYIKTKIIDKFLLLDTGLIVVLGGVSILFDNEIFFKVKPGLIGLILCILLGVSAFTRMNIFAGMSQRYMGDIKLNEEQLNTFRKSIKIMFFLFSAHTVLVFYSAFFMSKEAWSFISTVVFYAMFGAYFLFEIIKRKFFNKGPKAEWFPLVDSEGKIIGRATRQQCHSDKNLLHPVVHLHVINKQKQILLQKRAANKDVQPGKWDTSVGGHIAFGEKIEDALLRESSEELGLKNFNPQFLKKYVWASEVESELVFSFITEHEGPFKFQESEIDEIKFWSINEVKKNLGRNVFTPNFEHEFRTILK